MQDERRESCRSAARSWGDKTDEEKNGLRNFDMHTSPDAPQGMMAAAMPSLPTPPADPEVAARRYVDHALAAPQIPMAAPSVQGAEVEFKSLGVEEQPLTGTRTVKFRQQYHKIPVYGSLVTVQMWFGPFGARQSGSR
jgi:hypothetical protein